jgi:hypothetical protein
MPSFILRQLDPEFWAKVQAKAAAEGTTVKAVILRLLTAWLAAVILLSVTGCGYKNPTQPTIDTPQPGVPARLEIDNVPGTGDQAGTAAITARVIDAFATALEHQTVTFVATAGTLSAASAQTDAKGIARTTITAPQGGVTITATASGITAKTLAAVQPPLPPPPPVEPPPVSPPPPPPPIPPPPPPEPGTYSVTLRATPPDILVGGTTTLVATVSGMNDAPMPPSSFTWNCGNGTAATTTPSASSSCVYLTTGIFLAQVTATGGTVIGRGVAPVTVSPLPPPPPPTLTLSLTGTATSVLTGSTINYTATAGGFAAGETVTAYQWDLDETAGFEGTSTIPTRTSGPYTVSGLFVATVKVTTSTGRTASATFHYVVTN